MPSPARLLSGLDLVVNIAVSAFHSQQAGNVAIAILLAAGLVGLGFVRDDGFNPARQHGNTSSTPPPPNAPWPARDPAGG